MKNSLEDSDYDIESGKREEAHCSKCGRHLGAYGPGSDVITPCPKCRRTNLIDYTGIEIIVRRIGAKA